MPHDEFKVRPGISKRFKRLRVYQIIYGGGCGSEKTQSLLILAISWAKLARLTGHEV